MGIAGLTSYIQCYVRDSLEWHKLKNCHLVIDGNNLAHYLYNPKHLNFAFGGDYDKYSSYVEGFFRSLIQCNIKIYLVMDGGHPTHGKKFDTAFSRISQKIDICQNVKFANLSNITLFPLHGRSVFVDVAQRMNIDVITGDFEADEDIAVIAKHLDAYVLSNDSDFYLYGSKFIILDTINYKNVQTDKLEDGKFEKFIPSYRFDPDRFSKRTKISKDLIPLIAPLLGNDCLDLKCLETFYTKICKFRPTARLMSVRHKTIGSVFRWLSYQANQDPDAVLNKFIRFVPGSNSDVPEKDLFHLIKSSYIVSSSTLLSWNAKHTTSCPTKGMIDTKQKASPITLGLIKYNDDFLPPQIEREFRCNCDYRLSTNMLHGAELPPWFLKAYRMHLITSDIADILNKNYLFTLPQIEISSAKCVYLELKHIVTGVRVLLFKTLFEYFDREERGDKKFVKNWDILSKLRYEKKSSENEIIDSDDDENDFVDTKECDSDSDADVIIEDDEDDVEESLKRPRDVPNIGELRCQSVIPSMFWYMRKKDKLCGHFLPEEDIENFKHIPSLLEMDQLSLEERQTLFFLISKYEIKFTEQLPKNLEFILFCICFWYVKFKKHVTQSGVLAHLMCTLMFFVIDGKVGRSRPQGSNTNIQAASVDVQRLLASGALPDPSTLSILELINSLTKEECLLANLSLAQHHHVSINEISHPIKYRKIIHTFSAFQISVYFLQVLNSVLFFPYPTITINSFWSGMFCYSIQKRFQRSGFNSVLRLFGNNVRVKVLFIRLYNIIRKQVNLPQCFQKPCFMGPDPLSGAIENKENGNENAEKKRKKRSRKRKPKGPDAPEIDVWQDPTEADIESMAGNKFSQLILG